MASEDDIRDLNDPLLLFIPITPDHLARAQRFIESCKACNPDAELPFDWLLRDEASLDAQGYVDYILPAPAKCPKCKAEIYEKTLVETIDRSEFPRFNP